MLPPTKDTRIAVMGATGSGKSAFINLASGSDMIVGHGLESCTSDVQASTPFHLDGHIITLIDTPGFDDTTRSDTDILSCIAAYLAKIYEQGIRLAGIVYMHRISDVRMGGASKRSFHILRQLCGDDALRNVVIVTNMWAKVDPKMGEAREHELANDDKFFKPALEQGARLLRHDGTHASAQAIIRHLIDSGETTLLIQDEIVNQRKDLSHTTAGAELTRDLREQAERHMEELQKLHGEMEVAMRAKDEEARLEIEVEVNKRRQEMERIKRNTERMATDFIAEKARLESKLAQMEMESRYYAQGLQERVAHVREIETSHIEHMEIEEHPVRFPEEDHWPIAGDLLEARHHEDIHFLQQEIQRAENEKRKAEMAREYAAERDQEHIRFLQGEVQRVEYEKKQAEAEHAKSLRAERQRALALEEEISRQAKLRKEETARQVAQARDIARLRAEVARLQREMEKIIVEQERRKAAAASRAQPAAPMLQQNNTSPHANLTKKRETSQVRSRHRISLRDDCPFPTPSVTRDPPCHGRAGLKHPVFLGSAKFKSSVQPCKIAAYHTQRCRVAQGTCEITHHGKYYVLPFNPNTMEWVSTSRGRIPAHRTPVDGGYEENGAKLYHAIASINGLRIPGKTGEHLGGCNVTSDGEGYIIVHKYDILCWK